MRTIKGNRFWRTMGDIFMVTMIVIMSFMALGGIVAAMWSFIA